MNTSGLQGVLPATTLTKSVGVASPPMSISLASTAVGRKIEVSVDGGINYVEPTTDYSITAEIVVSVLAPITHVKFTGAAGDAWRVL